MRLNINNIMFVKKDKTLFRNEHKTIMEHGATGYVYNDNVEGVAVIPYRMGANGREILIRDEYSPLHNTVLSIITGRKDADDKNGQAAARRELLEEAGILAEERWFSEVGEILPSGSYTKADTMYVVDVTGVHQGRPETDGSIFEKKSSNMWVPVNELARMVREPQGTPDAFFLAAITKYLVWSGLFKSEESDLEKGKKGSEKPGHKYLRRKPSKKGQGYDYIYQEPKGKGPKKEDGKKKPTMVEQLAALIGKKQGGEEEKKPKKQLPWDEFSTVPHGMPDFKKGITAAQWRSKLDQMVTSNVNGYIHNLDDADHDMMNDPTRHESLYANVAMNMMDGVRNAYAATQTARDEIIIENKKLDDRAQSEVKGAIITASHALSNINHMTAVFNSSVTELIFDNFASKIENGRFKFSKLDKLSGIIASAKNNLEYLNESMQDIKWLQGSDPKLDWMVDQVYEAADGMMKARNRFTKNGLSFFIDQLSPKLESLKDAEEIGDSLKLLEQFEIFINEVVYSSTTASRLGVFANQWNMKQKGMYDGASRFSAYASGAIVDKVKGLEELGDDDILKGYINDVAKNDAFSFLSMSSSNEPFRMSEQIFAYVDMHGLDKYYQDMVFITGGRKEATIRNASPEHLKSTNAANHYPDCIATLTKAYNGEDVYHNDDALFQSEQSSGGIGSMKKGKYAALYTAMNSIVLLNKNAPIESKVPAFVRMWSVASHNSLISNAIEGFVDEKSIDRESYVNYHVASNRTVTPKKPAIKDTLAETIKSIYGHTQESLKKRKNEPIQLFRGNGDSEVKSTVSSWTSRDHIATNFGHVVSKVWAPPETVLIANSIENEDYWSYPQEREYVLVPGVLSADKKLQPEQLLSEQRQSIMDKKIEGAAEIYNEGY